MSTNDQTLTVKALTFLDARQNYGAGVNVNGDSELHLHFCKFINCRSANKDLGGGAIMVNNYGGPSTVNIYSTLFTNDVDNEADIFNSGNMTIHATCPSPYSSQTPTKGERDDVKIE